MKVALAAFFSSLLFGAGLIVSGMTTPSNVIGFLDVTGSWDPSLMFVMVGAIAVHSVLYRLIMQRNSPLLASEFRLPTKTHLDRRLVFGALVFGLGWGLGGFCPGPALVATTSLSSSVIVFVVFMIIGIYLFHGWSWLSLKIRPHRSN